MRDVMELLRAKEQELLKVKRQVEALRIALTLLGGAAEHRARIAEEYRAADF